MSASYITSRRNFLKSTGAAGISMYLLPVESWASSRLFQAGVLESPHWNRKTRKVSYRTDGRKKVTGSKVFSYDIRATDMPDWPQLQGHAFILRTTQADRIYEGLNLTLLHSDLQPDRLVQAIDLERDGLEFPPFFGDDILLPIGKTPAYLGQAVAILIYEDFTRYRQAKEALKFKDEALNYGAITGPIERDPWGTFRFVRMGGETPQDEDSFSSLKDSLVWPIGVRKHNPVWPEGRQGGTLSEEGMYYADLIEREVESPSSSEIKMSRRYRTQSTDTAAMEPENSNGWYDESNRALHLVVPTQSPQKVMRDMAAMLAKISQPVSQLYFHPCHTVGYGSKDHCNFPFYGAIASLYGGGIPIRLANDRYEQFQTSLKRHAFDVNYSLLADRKTGQFKALKADMVGNGGGRENFTPSVVLVAACAAQAVYYFPRSDISSVGTASRGVDCGSFRGYGTLQSMAATEMMIDELAEELNIDPIELRLRNVLKSGMKNTQGAIPAGAIRADEVLKRAAQHPMWVNRKTQKEAYERANPGKLYGVGFACVQKDFGNGAEASFARVEMSRDGRFTLYHSGTEIGTGMSTAQAIHCANILGSPADEAHFSVTEWPELPIEPSGDPHTMAQSEQDELEKNPRWSPQFCSSASASNSAYFMSHSTMEASKMLFNYGIWPAALAIWQTGIGGGQAASHIIRKEDARWVDGGLTANGMEVLSIERLAKKAYEMKAVTGAVAHVFNRWAWTKGDFWIKNRVVSLDVDAASLRYAGGEYEMLYRDRVYYPPTQRGNAEVTYYSVDSTIVELAINTATAQIELLRHHSILECGNMIVPELVYGQIEGGIAMGIGHALHEHLPLYEDGPGNGRWNFNRYHVPLAKDVAVWTQTHEVLPALSDTDPPKGMAEVVMIPVVAAISNAIANATGHRFRDLPIRSENIREILR